MTTRDGNILIDLGDGREIGLRIDNWALMQTQQKTGCRGMVELLQRIGIDDGNIDVFAFTILLMESANEYALHQKTGADPIDQRTASEYIDAMGGLVLAMAKITEGFKQYIPKNSQPPQMEGELILQ